ncbi:MAG: hypothetical protein UHG91_05065 [Succinivibrionaceae bacterium]|nr:hypothetical protein [Succinivibrionaceae bacterium]
MGNLAYVNFEVAGIQAFILGTKKLKEMIGGSEIIDYIAYIKDEKENHDLGKGFLRSMLEESKLNIILAKDARKPEKNDVLIRQANAGIIHMVFGDIKEARNFINKFGLKVLNDYPALPLFAALEECEFTKESLKDARFKCSLQISQARNRQPVPCGMLMEPLCEVSSLEDLPSIKPDSDLIKTYDKDARISLPSQTRQNSTLIKRSNERLHSYLNDNEINKEYTWSEDLKEIDGGSNRVAFIHMDGNDLGKLFRSALEEDKEKKKNEDPSEGIKNMGELSKLVEESSKAAFEYAIKAILPFANVKPNGEYIIPLRPLVLGGDDITAVVRADLGLIFCKKFAEEFENYSEKNWPKKIKEPSHLSLGIGMVICPTNYPFVKAFELAHQLLSNAKKKTKNDKDRKSSIDYLVITNEVETNLTSIRERLYTSQDNVMLTGKPYILDDSFNDFVLNGIDVLEKLPRSKVRDALNYMRLGKYHVEGKIQKLYENIERDLGGRDNSDLMTPEEFAKIFKNKSFYETKDGKEFTKLGDYLELSHLFKNKGKITLKDYRKQFNEQKSINTQNKEK